MISDVWMVAQLHCDVSDTAFTHIYSSTSKTLVIPYDNSMA